MNAQLSKFAQAFLKITVVVLLVNGCSKSESTHQFYNLPEPVTEVGVWERLDSDSFITQLLPSTTRIQSPQLKKRDSQYVFSFVMDDTYDVTPYDNYSNRLIALAVTDDLTEPKVTNEKLSQYPQLEDFNGRLIEQVMEPGKVYNLAVVIVILYGGTPRHTGAVVVSRIKVDLTGVH